MNYIIQCRKIKDENHVKRSFKKKFNIFFCKCLENYIFSDRGRKHSHMVCYFTKTVKIESSSLTIFILSNLNLYSSMRTYVLINIFKI